MAASLVVRLYNSQIEVQDEVRKEGGMKFPFVIIFLKHKSH